MLNFFTVISSLGQVVVRTVSLEYQFFLFKGSLRGFEGAEYEKIEKVNANILKSLKNIPYAF